MVSLQCAFFYEPLTRLIMKIFCCKHHIRKVCLQCVFSYELPIGLVVKIFCCKHHIYKVSLQCVFFYVLAKSFSVKIPCYKHHISQTWLQAFSFRSFPLTVRRALKFRSKPSPNCSLESFFIGSLNTSALTEFLIIKMRIFRDTVCKKIWRQKEFMWCFHFTNTKIIDVRDFATHSGA